MSLRISCLVEACPGEDGEHSTAGFGGAPRDCRIGVEHKDVTGVEHFFCSGAGQVECAFKHAGGELCPDVWVSNIAGGIGRYLDDPGDLPADGSGVVQWHFSCSGQIAAISTDMGLARDCERMPLDGREEESEIDAVGVGDLRECGECGNHELALQFGEERS